MEQHDESLMQTNTQHFVLVQPGVELPAVKQLCDRAKGNDLKALSYSASPADSGKVGSFKFNVPPAKNKEPIDEKLIMLLQATPANMGSVKLAGV